MPDASCCDGLIFKYGTYEHPAGECYPSAVTFERKRSPRGLRWATVARIVVSGSLVGATTEAEVKIRMEEIIEEYSKDYKDAGFYYSDGITPTTHLMTNSPQDDLPYKYTNLSGVQVTQRSWDNQYATELANTRSFSIILESTYLDYYSLVLNFTESVSKTGTGGEKWKLNDNWDLEPIREIIQPQSSIKYIQQGKIIGVSGFILPNAPLYGSIAVPSDYEHSSKRTVLQRSPQAMGHLNVGGVPDQYIGYTTEYKYVFELTKTQDQGGSPGDWPT